jgi:hypothetical protein
MQQMLVNGTQQLTTEQKLQNEIVRLQHELQVMAQQRESMIRQQWQTANLLQLNDVPNILPLVLPYGNPLVSAGANIFFPDNQFLAGKWIIDLFVPEDSFSVGSGTTHNPPSNAVFTISKDQVTTHQQIPVQMLLQPSGTWRQSQRRFRPFKMDLVSSSFMQLNSVAGLNAGEVCALYVMYLNEEQEPDFLKFMKPGAR